MIVVAGIGNMLQSDDGFGPAVVAALGQRAALDDTDATVVDAGIRGVHVAFDLADGVDLLIAVDLVAADAAPGEVVVLEPALDDIPPSVADGHGIDLRSMLDLATQIGTGPAKVLIVGCRPETIAEGIGLSPSVTAAVDTAARVVEDLVRSVPGGAPCSVG